ncbi:MAG: hypothetical protein ABSB22_15040 [Thermodesulfobacteriota bacterium]
MILPRQVCIYGLFKVLPRAGTHSLEVGHHVCERDIRHRPDVLHRLPETMTLGAHVESVGPSIGPPHLGSPAEVLPDPPILNTRHVPDYPSNVIGVDRGLPARLRGR